MKYFTIGIIAIHLLILTQLRFEVWPEILVMPYLMKNGFELYRDMIVPWTPGLMWILNGWFKLAGLSVDGLKLLTWGMIAVIDLQIYYVAAKKWREKAGLAALTFFVLLQPVFDGNGMWFDLAAAPFLLLAFYWRQPLLLAPAFLIKQSAMWLLPVFVREWRKVLFGILGILGGLGISMAYFFSKGLAGDYWFWAYDFAFRRLPAMPGHRDLGNWRLWILALAPFVLVGVIRGTRSIKNISGDPFYWAILAIPFAIPRLGLFHFQPAIAFLALTVGSLIKSHKSYKTVKTYFLLSLILVYLGFSWYRIIQSQWQKPNRFLEPEVYQLAAKVALETKKEEQVLLVNGPESVYFLADRLPPKPWLTQFPWFLELPGFQEDLVTKFKQQNLDQVFITPYLNEGKFVPGSYRPKILLNYVEGLSLESGE